MVAVNERDLSSTSGRPGRSRPGCVIIRFLLVCCLVVAGLATGVAATTATAGAVTPTSTWNEQSPATSPPDLEGASMAYDPATGDVLLFGGSGSDGLSDETWTWDGSTWTEQSPADMPPAETGASMAYD